MSTLQGCRKNLIMALILTIFFHDRLLRACRSTKVNTTTLMAFDSPNLEPLVKMGITNDENEHLFQPRPHRFLGVKSKILQSIIIINTNNKKYELYNDNKY